jgi:Tol biopolymer transport system component
MSKAAFFADSAIWIVPVSHETGRATGEPSRLLDGGYKFANPVNWSPDGERIAFTRDEKNIELDIWTISVSGSELQRITNSPDIESYPCWSPDCNKIAFRKGAELWLASANGEDHHMILKRSEGAPFCWSSDNKWLILQSSWGNPHLYSFELYKDYELNVPERVGEFVSFSPDGEKLVFYRSSHDDKWPLKIVSSSGGASYKPAGNEAAYGSNWLRDNQHIMLQGEDEQGNITMNLISLSGGNPLNITIEADVNGEPFPYYILPDNKHICFSVERDSGRKDLFIAEFSVQEARTIGPARMIFQGWSGGAYNVCTSWSSDGKKLALSHEGDIWIVPLESGNPIQITDTPDEERWVDWSPDGKWISYKIFDQSKKVETLYVIQPGKEPARIVHRNCSRETIWNSDSESIILFSNSELQRISLDGTLLEDLLNIKNLGLDVVDSPCLSPDGKSLAFVGYESYESGERSMIIKYSFDSKEITRLATDDPYDYKYSLSWSPDGKWISYLTYEEIKVRPEGYLWEADFEEIIKKLIPEP